MISVKWINTEGNILANALVILAETMVNAAEGDMNKERCFGALLMEMGQLLDKHFLKKCCCLRGI